MKKKVIDLPEVGNMSSTNSANPLSCYAGLAVIDEIKSKNLISKTKLKGRILIDFLNKLKENFPEYILSIQGRVLIAAIIFKNLKSENISRIYKKLKANKIKFNAVPQKSSDNKVKMTYCRTPEGVFLELVEEL